MGLFEQFVSEQKKTNQLLEALLVALGNQQETQVVPPQPAAPGAITKEALNEALMGICAADANKIPGVQTIIAQYGATDLNGVAPEHYAAIKAAAEAL